MKTVPWDGAWTSAAAWGRYHEKWGRIHRLMDQDRITSEAVALARCLDSGTFPICAECRQSYDPRIDVHVLCPRSLDFAPFRGPEWDSPQTAPADFLLKWRWDSSFHQCCGAARMYGEKKPHECSGPPMLLPYQFDASVAEWSAEIGQLGIIWHVEFDQGGSGKFYAVAKCDGYGYGNCSSRGDSIPEAIQGAIYGMLVSAWNNWRREKWAAET